MNIEIWTIGKENDSHIEDGIRLYFQKIKPWTPIELVVIQLPQKVATTDVERSRKQEEVLILKRLQGHHYL